jgi:hypothetical protein
MGSKAEKLTMSKFFPVYPRKRTYASRHFRVVPTADVPLH